MTRVREAVGPWRLAARFALVFAVTAAALHLLLPLVAPGFARMARNLILLSTPVPVIGDVEWTGNDFRVRSPAWDGLPLYQVAARTEGSVVTFSLAVPLAAAFALPGGGRRRTTVAWLLLAGACVCTVYLAVSLTANLDGGLTRRGLEVFPPWRVQLHELVRRHGWPLCAIVLPGVASLWVASRSVFDRSAADGMRLWPLVACVGVLVALASVGERVAQHRSRPVSASELLDAVDPWNDSQRAYLLAAAQRHHEAGARAHAREALSLAARYAPPPDREEH